MNSIRLANQVARDYFGYSALRPVQEQAIASVMDGRDTWVVVPTSSGKSAIYQIPAIISEGTAIVFSPLIALMTDQVQKLHDWGVRAARLTGDMSDTEVQRVMRSMDDYSLMYVAPERLKSGTFLRQLRQIKVSMIVLDEAHMLPQAQQDFRPAYTMIGKVVRQYFPEAPRLALTATADREEERIVTRSLGMEDYTRIVQSPRRDNLEYHVLHDIEDLRLLHMIRAEGWGVNSGCAVVYASTRQRVYDLARDLRTMKFASVEPYHGGMTGEARQAVQDRFMTGETRIIVATNAFGLGVDKSDVRAVIHADPPDSIHAYLQEAGRGGRDGKPCTCVLNIKQKGLRSRRFFIECANPAKRYYDAVWERWSADRKVREPFDDDTRSLMFAILAEKGVSKIMAPYFATTILNYLQFRGVIQAIPDKTVQPCRPRNLGAFQRFASRHRASIRRIRPNEATVTVYPGRKSPIPAMLGSHAIYPFTPDQRAIEHYKLMRLTEEHGILAHELSDKRSAAYDRLRQLQDFAEAPDKHEYIDRVYGA